MHVPDIELLWWAGCPSTARALAELQVALEETGLSGVEVRMTEIRDGAQARERGFVGSPTILVDGEDVAAAGEDVAPAGEEVAPAGEIAAAAGEEEIGLNCRVYRRRDGRISPTPDREDLRGALRRAVGNAREEMQR